MQQDTTGIETSIFNNQTSIKDLPLEVSVDSLNKDVINLKELVTSQSIKIDSVSNFYESMYHSLNQSINNDDQVLGLPLNFARIIIPVVVTILVFITGQLITWIKTKFERRSEILSYRDTILRWVDLIQTSIDIQTASCKSIATKIKESPDIHPEAFSFTKFLANKVSEISITKYIDVFVTNSNSYNNDDDKHLKERWCYNLVSGFTFFHDMEQEIKTTYQAYEKNTMDLLEEWNQNFKEFDNLISFQMREVALNEDHPHKRFNENVMKVISEWQGAAEGGNTVRLSNNNLVLPLTTLVHSELRQVPSNDFAFDLSACLQRFRLTYQQANTNSTAYSNLFESLAKKLDGTHKTLYSTREYIITRTKVKPIWKIK